MNINTTTNHSPVDVYNYAVGSFIKTEFPVKVLLLAMLALAALIVRNIFLALGNFFARKGRLFYS